MWNDLPLILAQASPPEASPPPQIADQSAGDDLSQPLTNSSQTGTSDKTGDETSPSSGLGIMPIVLLAVVLLFVVSMGGGRKEKKRRAAMLAAMGKGDKIQTIGGILGTVLDIKDDEVVVKVDENANARLRFAKSAIQSVVTSSESDADQVSER